jgi:hypothetical protein
MSDRTAEQAVTVDEPRRLFDRAFPIGFGLVALLATSVWFAAMGWIAWQPIRFLADCILD